MFGSIVDDFKNVWNRPNSGLQRIIIINAVIFVIVNLVNVFAGEGIFTTLVHNIQMPIKLNELLYKPWTYITSFFMHVGFWHLFWNMIFLYWFGRLVFEYLGDTKLINIYFLGGLVGSLSVLILFNLVPEFREAHGYAWGASACVFAISTAAATLLPDHKFHLLLLGPVKIKYIVGIQILLAVFGLNGGNVGGEVAHLAGAAMGYIYIRQLQKGHDLGAWINSLVMFVKSLFVKQSNIKVSYKRSDSKKSSSKSKKPTKNASGTTQDEIDAILDKINASGYESLSSEEKQKLFNAGK